LFADAQANKYRDVTVPLKLAEPYFFNVDLANLDDVDSFIAEYKKAGLGPAKALINNAGLVSTSTDKTKQGFETTFGVNFVSAAYLTKRLLAEHLITDRVVSVSSEDHRVSQSIDDIWRTKGKRFGEFWADGLIDALPRYDFSKLAMTTYFLALARKQSDVAVFDMCPGPVDSEIAISSAPWPIGNLVKTVMSYVMIPIDEAAIPVLRLAISDEFNGRSGEHLHISETRPARADARDVNLQDQVYNWFEEEVMTKRG
jgi:NAD(P)-dependent dehydrogenase (short-subunit alcohol dehydrogenase family)